MPDQGPLNIHGYESYAAEDKVMLCRDMVIDIAAVFEGFIEHATIHSGQVIGIKL